MQPVRPGALERPDLARNPGFRFATPWAELDYALGASRFAAVAIRR